MRVEDPLEELFKEAEENLNRDSAEKKRDDIRNDEAQLKLELEKFRKFPRIDKKSNILTFWQQQKDFKKLSELSKIVFAVPVSQASVERAFSTLRYILSDLRGNILSTNLENILLIKLNKHLVFESNKAIN